MAARYSLELPRWTNQILHTTPRQEEPTKPASWPKESLPWHAPRSTNVNRGESATRCSRAWPQLHDELGPEQQSQITLPADMGGCAIRSCNRKGAGVAARWEALSDTLPRAQRALETLGYWGCWKQARQELDDATNKLCNSGVVVCDGMPVVACTLPSLHVLPHNMHTRTPHSHRAR